MNLNQSIYGVPAGHPGFTKWMNLGLAVALWAQTPAGEKQAFLEKEAEFLGSTTRGLMSHLAGKMEPQMITEPEGILQQESITAFCHPQQFLKEPLITVNKSKEEPHAPR